MTSKSRYAQYDEEEEGGFDFMGQMISPSQKVSTDSDVSPSSSSSRSKVPSSDLEDLSSLKSMMRFLADEMKEVSVLHIFKTMY